MAARNAPSRAGELLAEKYRLEERLAVGGMGEVYRAINLAANRPVAIKLLRRDLTGNTEVVRRFLREGRAANRVNHPNIVRVIDIDKTGEQVFIVQDLLEGEDLSRLLKRSGRKIPVADALEILIPVADALAAAHDVGLVHRDLKPANIFLSEQDGSRVPKVLDFGIAKVMTADVDGDTPLTQTGSPLGTPAYMSPEQIVTPKAIDARSDVWAMGVLIHRTVTGRLPFRSDSAGGVMVAICTEAPRALADDLPGAPDALQDVVSGCLMRNRDERFATCAAVARALRGASEIIAEEISGFQVNTPEGPQRRMIPTLQLDLPPSTAPPASAPSSTPLPRSDSRPVAAYVDAFDDDDDDLLGLAPTVLQGAAPSVPPPSTSHSVIPQSGSRSIRPAQVASGPPAPEVVTETMPAIDWRIVALAAAAVVPTLVFAWGVGHYNFGGLGDRIGGAPVALVGVISCMAALMSWHAVREGNARAYLAAIGWSAAAVFQLYGASLISGDGLHPWLSTPTVVASIVAVIGVAFLGFVRSHALLTAHEPDKNAGVLLAGLSLVAAAVAVRILL